MTYYINAFDDGSNVWIVKYDRKNNTMKEFDFLACRWGEWSQRDCYYLGEEISKQIAKSIVKYMKSTRR